MFRDGAERFLVFGVGAERFARGAVGRGRGHRAPPVHRIPDAPQSVLGVTSMRGALVTFYDPRVLLDVEGDERGQRMTRRSVRALCRETARATRGHRVDDRRRVRSHDRRSSRTMRPIGTGR